MKLRLTSTELTEPCDKDSSKLLILPLLSNAVHSRFPDSLDDAKRRKLENDLWESQNHKCFICDKSIDLVLHKDSIEVDHIEPLSLGGKDEESNFGLVHMSCNRSKQASNLRVARVLAKFEDIKERTRNQGPHRPNLSDVFAEFGGAKYDLPVKLMDSKVEYTLSDIGRNEVLSTPLFIDDLTQSKYFFVKLPIEYLFHDDRINPRGIGGSLHKLVEEFFRKRPQLHISLGWANIMGDSGRIKVKVFDGQHKAAAQVLLGARTLPLRIFLNPDLDTLLTTNTNAGTVLRQVAFDKSVQRHLGSNLYWERIKRYQQALGKDSDDYNFSEKDLMSFFKGEHREIKRYILDDVRDSVTYHPENRLRDFIDFAGRAKEKPISYSSIEKTFYSLFIYQDLLDVPINYKIDMGDNPRQLEKDQIVRLMNIIADEIYVGKFDTDIGTLQIEKRLQKGDIKITEDHFQAHRMSREEILYNWIDILNKIIKRYFLMQGRPFEETRLFQYKFPEPLWDSLKRVVRNLARLSLWKNKELSSTVFGGRQTYAYWRTIFETGKTPQGLVVMPKGLNLDELLVD